MEKRKAEMQKKMSNKSEKKKKSSGGSNDLSMNRFFRNLKKNQSKPVEKIQNEDLNSTEWFCVTSDQYIKDKKSGEQNKKIAELQTYVIQERDALLR